VFFLSTGTDTDIGLTDKDASTDNSTGGARKNV